MSRFTDFEDSDLQAPAATECERCGCVSSELKGRNGQLVCWECRDEIDLAAWLAQDEEPLNLMCAHTAEFAHCGSTAATVRTDRLYCNPAAVCCEEEAA